MFNNIYIEHLAALARPAGAADRTAPSPAATPGPHKGSRAR
ncbi:MAG TPA: hypothetical protein VGB74_21285 [Actinoplanes sp.]|jgi:hypothetical protein